MLNKRITCEDGFSMSVQANQTAYCHPRIDNADKYTAVEVGYPSMYEPWLIEWAEEKDSPCDTVYGWVPVHVILTVCAKHGGIISGELPPGIPRLLGKDK